MFKFIFLVFSSSFFTQSLFSDFSVDVQLLEPISREKIKLKVQVKNLTNKTVEILSPRRQDFRWKKINSSGNYVIEIEKYANEEYDLFEPSADIDPIFQREEYVSLQADNSITDTLYINGFSFSRRTESKRGFPSGKYRLRVYFNSDMWNVSQRNSSNWIDFTIE